MADHCIVAMSRALAILSEKEPDGCKCGVFLRPIIAQLERAIADRRADRDPAFETTAGLDREFEDALADSGVPHSFGITGCLTAWP